MAEPSNKALQTDKGICHAFCTRKSHASLPLPLSLVVRQRWTGIDRHRAQEGMKSTWVFVMALALVFYGNGAAFIESFVNYPSWPLVGENEFTRFHQFLSPRVVTFLVIPALTGTLFTVLMLWFRPMAIPSWAVWVAIALQAIVWVSTATIQIPIQLQLSESGLSLELIDRLIETNWWFRRIPYAGCALLFLWMGATAVAGGDRRAA
jgi:hypothetical protein